MPTPARDSLIDAADYVLADWRASWRLFMQAFDLRVASGEFLDRWGYLFGLPRPRTLRPHWDVDKARTMGDHAYRLLLRNAARWWDRKGARTTLREIVAAYTWMYPLVEEAYDGGSWVWVVGESYVGTVPQTIVGGAFDYMVHLFNCQDESEGGIANPAFGMLIEDGLLTSLRPLHATSGYFRDVANSRAEGPINDTVSTTGLGEGDWDEGLEWDEDEEIVKITQDGAAQEGLQYTSPYIELGYLTHGFPGVDRAQLFADWVYLAAPDADVTVTAEIRGSNTPYGGDWEAVSLDGDPPKDGGSYYNLYQIRLTITGTFNVEDFALLYVSIKWLRDGYKSQGTLRFTGSQGTTVPEGTRVETASGEHVRFETTEGDTIGAGGTLDLAAECQWDGENGNVSADTLTVMVDEVVGVTGVTNPSATVSGQDDEAAYIRP